MTRQQKFSINVRTTLVLNRSGNHVLWHVERVIDGARRIVLRGLRTPKADFSLQHVIGRLRSIRIGDHMTSWPKDLDPEL